MELLIALITSAMAYRYSGMDKPFNKTVWGLGLFIGLILTGVSSGIALVVSILGLAGRQFISHGAVYQLIPGARSEAPWASICFVRTIIMLFPFSCLSVFHGGLIAGGAAFLMLGVNKLSRFLEHKKYISDMLYLAEPLQGVIFFSSVYLAIQLV